MLVWLVKNTGAVAYEYVRVDIYALDEKGNVVAEEMNGPGEVIHPGGSGDVWLITEKEGASYKFDVGGIVVENK